MIDGLPRDEEALRGYQSPLSLGGGGESVRGYQRSLSLGGDALGGYPGRGYQPPLSLDAQHPAFIHRKQRRNRTTFTLRQVVV